MTVAQLLHAARVKTSVRFLLLQAGLAAAAFVLFLLWLRIPDANVAEVLFSALLALVLLLIVAGGEAWLLLRARSISATPTLLVRGGAAILIAAALLLPLSALLNHLGAADSLRAGYLNSQLSVGIRHVLTYPRLLMLFQQMWASLFWAVAIALSMAAVAVVVARRPLHALGRMLRSITAWVLLSVAAIVACEATLKLLHWTPGHGLSIETVSLLLRIASVAVIDSVLLCFSLALLVALAEESDSRYAAASTDAGTPDRSQPRTVPNP